MKTAGRLLNFMMVLIAVTVLTLITLYCAAGRIALSQLPEYRAELEQVLSDALSMPVAVASIEGSLVGFDPVISLRGMSLNGSESASLAQMRVRISFLRSLLSQKLDIQSLEVEQLNIALQQTDSGDWLFGESSIVDLLTSPSDTETPSDRPSLIDQWLSLDDLTAIVSKSEFRLKDEHGVARNWRAPVVHLDYRGDDIAASGQILEPDSNAPMFSFALRGDDKASAEHFLSTVYIELRSGTLLDEVLKTYEWQGLSIQDIDASGRVWLNFEDFALRRASGDLQLKQLDWMKQAVAQTPLQNLDLNLTYNAAEAHRLTLSGLRIGAPQADCISSRIALTQDGQTLDLQMDQLDLTCALGLADLLGVMSDELKGRVTISKPQGRLHNIYLSLPLKDSSAPAFTLRAELQDVGLQPYESTPGGHGVDGYVEAVPGSGRVIFDSDRFSLFFPTLYYKPFVTRHAEGQVGWYENGDEVVISSQGLRLYLSNASSSQDSLIYGDFIARLNPADQEDVLALQLGVQDVPFIDVLNYVPYTVSPGVYKWLGQSMQGGGMVRSGIYVGYGSVESNSARNSFTSSLQMHTSDGELKFQPSWPTLTSLDVTVDLQNDALWVSGVKRADLLGHPVDNISVVLDPDYARKHNKGVSVLAVDLKTSVVNEQLHYWLAESPVSDNSKALADQLKLEGEVDGTVKLLIPMAGDGPVRYDILLSLADETLHHLPSKLTLRQVKGEIRLTDQKGLAAKNIVASLFGHAAKLEIDSVVGSSAKAAQTRITLSSHVQVKSWLDHYQLPQVRGITGGFDFFATLNLRDALDPHLSIVSDMRGLVRDLPEPLAKTADSKERLSVDLLLKSDQTRVATDWITSSNTPIRTSLEFTELGLTEGEILIGKARASQEHASGLFVGADVESLDLASWVDFLASDAPFLTYPEKTKEQLDKEEPRGQQQLLQKIELKAATLNAYDELLTDVSATITPPEQQPEQTEQQTAPWLVALSGPSVAGTVKLPYQNKVLELELEHLHLSRPEPEPEVPRAEEKKLEEKTDAEKAVEEALLNKMRSESDPAKLPSMTVAVKSLKLGNDDYGAWRTQVASIPGGVLFKNINGSLNGARIKGLLEWKKNGAVRHSSMALINISGVDMAGLLTFFDVNDLITSQKYASDLSLHWNDMPSLFALSKLSGTVSLDMEKGVLVTDDTKTGFLRVFGALNPATIFRRLKLDFSDLVTSGITYDTLSVKAAIDKGLVSMKDPLMIRGPSSNYDIRGNIDMADKKLDLDMTLTLPLTENVPLAALMLGAPIVGGAVWVVDKLLGQPLSSLTTAGYSVTGPWSLPILELKEVVTAGERRILKPKK